MIDTIYNILNVLLDEELIESPPIVEPKLPNGIPKHFHYEEFCNYHRVPKYLTCNYRSLQHIIHDFINQGDINMDAKPTKQVGLIHPNHEQLRIFMNPLPSLQS